MGTRNLTMVYEDGAYKVAQYGQWDGYPEGQGMDTLHFLRDKMNEALFRERVHNATFISESGLNALWKKYGADEHGMVTIEDADRMKKDYPQFSRDTGAEIFYLIQSSPNGVQLSDSLDFIADGLFCEWAWLIDLDARTFEGYRGFNQERLGENDRFAFMEEKVRENGYHPPKLVAKWSLDDLPDDDNFLAAF